MGLSRKYLTELGLEGETINKIMAEYGKAIQGLQTEEDFKAQMDIELKKARAEWQKELPAEKTVNDFEEYKKAVAELKGYKLNDKLASAKVQKKYFDIVKSKMTDEANFDNDITSLKASFPEFFEKEEPQRTPETKNPLFSQQQNGGKQLTKEEAFLEAIKKI